MKPQSCTSGPLPTRELLKCICNMCLSTHPPLPPKHAHRLALSQEVLVYNKVGFRSAALAPVEFQRIFSPSFHLDLNNMMQPIDKFMGGFPSLSILSRSLWGHEAFILGSPHAWCAYSHSWKWQCHPLSSPPKPFAFLSLLLSSWQAFSVQGQTANMLGSVGHTVSVELLNTKAAKGKM